MSTIILDNILTRLFSAGGAVQSEILFRSLKKSLLALFMPMLVLAVAGFMLTYVGKIHPAILGLFHYIPYVILVAGLALAWRFNRPRAFFPLLTLAIGYWCIQEYVSGTASLRSDVVYAFLSILIPVNYLVFGLLPERGIFTQKGLLRFVFIAVQVLLCAFLVRYSLKTSGSYLYSIIDTQGWLPSSQLPQLSQPVIALSLLLLVARIFQKRNAVEGGLVVSLAAMTMALLYINNQFLMISYVSLAVLVILMTVIQDSWQMAYVDDLTGLPGRRALNEQLLKLGQFYTVAMVDVDHFKKFNDTYGHDVGDQALRFVAAKLESISSGGKAYRYGGEEFTLLFPNRSKSECKDALKAIHRAISESRFTLRAKDRPREKPETPVKSGKMSKGVKITVSIGVASCKNGSTTPREVIKKADAALYKAKDAGRNCIRS